MFLCSVDYLSSVVFVAGFQSRLDNHHFDFMNTDNPSFVVCSHFPPTPASLRSSVEEIDSGCPLSIGSTNTLNLEDDPSALDVSYMVRHVSDDVIKPDKKLVHPADFHKKSRGSVAMIVCEKDCEGYWSKEQFQKPPPDSISRCSSNDTGCGSDCCNEEESCGDVKYGMEGKKHPFIKTTSKDSGVLTTSGFLCSSRESMSDVSEGIPEEEFSCPPTLCHMNYPDHMAVSCMQQPTAAH